MVKIFPQIGSIGDPLREMAEDEYYMDHSSGSLDLIPDMGPYAIFIPLSIFSISMLIMFILIRFKATLIIQILTGLNVVLMLAAGTWLTVELIRLMG